MQKKKFQGSATPFTEKAYFKKGLYMKKFLFLVLILISFTLISSAFCVTAFAEDENAAYTEEETEITEENGTEENTFSTLYDFTLENLDKIFSALAFIASLILVFAYKKGLIPIVNTSLLAIRKNAEKLGEASSDSLMNTEKSIDLLTEKFASVMNTAESISNSVDSLFERLDFLESESKSKDTLRTVMLSQVDMLYEIFMNSSLPQYSKDALGERIADMKKTIRSGEENV